MMKRLAIFLAVVVLGALDTAVKSWALRSAPTVPTNPIVGIALHKNPGIAFDIPLPLWLILALSVVALTGVVVIMRRDKRLGIFLSTSLVLIGALDNAIDRIVHGFTTDYIILFSHSVINLADLMILAGAAMLLWYYQGTPARSK